MKADRNLRALGVVLTVAVTQLGCGLFSVAAHAAADSPAMGLAAQIRTQGYTCDTPVSARKDRKHSRPDEALWYLTCGKAHYRIRLIPDMAARVERISP